MQHWYSINQVASLDSPSLLIYTQRLHKNIEAMQQLVASNQQLMPHIKTNKMPEVVKLLLQHGINQVKCATIAEAEVAAAAGMNWVLIAHQLVGPKMQRLLQLTEAFPQTTFASLIDCHEQATQLAATFAEANQVATVYIDVNSGMNRSGCEVQQLGSLLAHCLQLPQLVIKGWHIYDGHHRHPDFDARKSAISADMEAILAFIKALPSSPTDFVVGGTPAFTSHATYADRICSPGTCLFWDWGYGDTLLEQPFQYAALVLTRIISKPTQGLISVDLGHKAIAAENPIHQRVRFLNLADYELVSQSEEHGVIRVGTETWQALSVGDVLYGVPYHVCPTVNLYDTAYVIDKNDYITTWEVAARRRRLSY